MGPDNAGFFKGRILNFFDAIFLQERKHVQIRGFNLIVKALNIHTSIFISSEQPNLANTLK
jgi:hypothetical protein